MATVVCAVIAVPLIVTVLRSSKYPPINDITTDFDNSPEFVNAQKLQHEPNRDMKYDKAKYADRQLAGYGPIGPIKEHLTGGRVRARDRGRSRRLPTWTITVFGSGHEHDRGGRDVKAVAFQRRRRDPDSAGARRREPDRDAIEVARRNRRLRRQRPADPALLRSRRAGPQPQRSEYRRSRKTCRKGARGSNEVPTLWPARLEISRRTRGPVIACVDAFKGVASRGSGGSVQCRFADG